MTSEFYVNPRGDELIFGAVVGTIAAIAAVLFGLRKLHGWAAVAAIFAATAPTTLIAFNVLFVGVAVYEFILRRRSRRTTLRPLP